VPYTHFQMIAWEVPTVAFAKERAALSGWAPGQECDAIATIPVPDGIVEDARIRLGRLAAVVDRAAAHVDGQPAADIPHDAILKIFLVPEFYLRPPADLAKWSDWDLNPGNSYEARDAEAVISALSVMFVHPRFAHWLFVCGTLMANTAPAGASPADQRSQATYFNTAVVVRGGPGQPQSPLLIEKYMASPIDGVPLLDEVERLADARSTGNEYKGPLGKRSLALLFEDWLTRAGRVFVRDGITFGIEICLDHSGSRALRRVLEEWPEKTREPAPGIDLHILVAGGMKIGRPSVAARGGGYIMRSDGVYFKQATPSQLWRVRHYSMGDDQPGTSSLPVDWRYVASLANTDGSGASIVGTPLPITDPAMLVPDPPAGWSTGDLVPTQPNGPYGPKTSTFTQQIVCYPPLMLPTLGG
jgi:hypothetical protein